MMRITTSQLLAQAARVSTRDRLQLRAAIARTRARHVSVELLIALMSRETNIANIVGDGGHGRGYFQLDDRFQVEYLRGHRGCPDGTNRPRWRSALPKGRVPTLYAGAKRACQLIEANVWAAELEGVPFGHRVHFAAAAYNAGVGNALNGWRHSRDPDLFTTGRDYGADVLARRDTLRA
jgi:hypothetical protein